MTLRPMTMADADFMLELKNDPDTRRFAIVSHEEIKREDHVKWLGEHLPEFQVIENLEFIPVGAFRIHDNEISIWIHKDYRGQRIASQIISRVSTDGMKAKIVNGNISSFRAFNHAGFMPVDYKDNYYILQC